ncbi:hypothetical protein ORI20_31165 [Mycobacterium sp. CVI_P3]|nr:hypothetical protein [Mycobacterium pinniadriaticum]MCX2934729.1 hypothetical protein [Mycobacterium pinniadriaticum]
MRKSVVKGMCLVASVVFAAGIFGVGVASAGTRFAGQTYAKAAAKLQSEGLTPVIATVIGGGLAIDDCIVAHSYRPMTVNQRGRRVGKGTFLLDLNCNRAVAAPGKPGNSVMSPEGKRAKALETRAEGMYKNITTALANGKVPGCGTSAAKATECKSFCDRSGLCPDEVLKYLASL